MNNVLYDNIFYQQEEKLLVLDYGNVSSSSLYNNEIIINKNRQLIIDVFFDLKNKNQISELRRNLSNVSRPFSIEFCYKENDDKNFYFFKTNYKGISLYSNLFTEKCFRIDNHWVTYEQWLNSKRKNNLFEKI